jgi:hypothetical protein
MPTPTLLLLALVAPSPGLSLEWELRGGRRSRRAVDEVARALELGHTDIELAGGTRLK